MAGKKQRECARKLAALVRFSDEEYRDLTEDSSNTGKSIPELLRERYFKRQRPRPLLSKVDMGRFFATMGRICTDLSHIDRKINSGIREGFVSEVDDAKESYNMVLSFLAGHRCCCKPIRQKLQMS